MGKDPAFLFYSSDFLTGTMFMTYEQKGLYISLLCAQHQHGGRIDTNVLRTQCAGITGGDAVLAKFKFDERGAYQPRLEEEMNKRSAKSTKARDSVKKRWQKNSIQTQYESNTNVLRSENENENENEIDLTKEWGEKSEKEILAIRERFSNETYLNQLSIALQSLKANKEEIKQLVGLFFDTKQLNGELNKPEGEIRRHLTNFLKKEIPVYLSNKTKTNVKLNQSQQQASNLEYFARRHAELNGAKNS